MSQNFKQFVISSRSDYVIYLRQLIVAAHKSIKRYELYTQQLNEKIEELKLRSKPNLWIDSEIYEEMNDKIGNVSSKLLNLFGDLQSDSMSYYKFRKMLLKRNIEVKNDLGDLSKEMQENLASANTNRNWALHMPESLLNAHIVNIKKLLKKEDVAEYLHHFNPIGDPQFQHHEGKWLISLYEECENNLESFREAYQSMVSDYEKLISTEPILNEVPYKVRPFESEIMLPKTSFEMQQRKYRG